MYTPSHYSKAKQFFSKLFFSTIYSRVLFWFTCHDVDSPRFQCDITTYCSQLEIFVKKKRLYPVECPASIPGNPLDLFGFFGHIHTLGDIFGIFVLIDPLVEPIILLTRLMPFARASLGIRRSPWSF